MTRPRSGRSTIGRDPWDAVIPGPASEPPESPHEGRRTRKPRPARKRPAAGVRADGPTVGPAAPVEAPEPRPAPPPVQAQRGTRQKLTVHLDEALVNRVKNAAYWNPRLTIARIAEEGIRLAIERVEREYGGPYPRREADLVGGRPIK